MYGLVPYNISDIQKGVQFGHGVVEYANRHFDSDEYQQWSKNDKTFVILNGGTTNNNPDKLGTLNKHLEFLQDFRHDFRNLNFNVEYFTEEDLGNQLTAVVFLLDERFWDKSYPDAVANFPQYTDVELAEFLKKFKVSDYNELFYLLKLRDFVKSFRLA
jgi:hypothetical protein